MPWITIDEKRFFFSRTASESSRDALVLLHGSGGDRTVWSFQVRELCGFCSVVAPDLPGHGLSDGPGSDSAAGYAGWLERFAGACGLERFFLAGHSLGGAVAQEYARVHPQRLSGVVLAGTASKFSFPRHYVELLKKDFVSAVDASCDSAYGPSAPEKLRLRGRRMLLRNGPDILLKDIDVCSRFSSESWAGTLDVPTLVVRGKEDRVVHPGYGGELDRALSRCRRIAISGSGHMVMQESPRVFNAALKDFMEQRSGS